MDVWEAIVKRVSVRRFLNKAVEKEKIEKLIQAARYAPSASNRQEWRFVVVQDKGRIGRLAEAACGQTFINAAALVIAACAETDNHIMRCGQLSYPIDVAIACEHIVLEAVELGLGSCWIGAFYEEQVKEILEIPPHIRVVELLAVGYPDSENMPPRKKKLPWDEIAFSEAWGRTLDLT